MQNHMDWDINRQFGMSVVYAEYETINKSRAYYESYIIRIDQIININQNHQGSQDAVQSQLSQLDYSTINVDAIRKQMKK